MGLQMLITKFDA